jgi:hypothetical protein
MDSLWSPQNLCRVRMEYMGESKDLEIYGFDIRLNDTVSSP